MKLHVGSQLTENDLYRAANVAGMGVHVDYAHEGSRSHDHGYVVHLTGTSSRRPNGGSGQTSLSDDYAATWDEWGMFLAHLFSVDPEMQAGPARGGYAGAEDFHWQTSDRFRELTPAAQHGRAGHRWDDYRRERDVEHGRFNVHMCDCGAEMRRSA